MSSLAKASLTEREQASSKHQLHTQHFVYVLDLIVAWMGALILELDGPSSKSGSFTH